MLVLTRRIGEEILIGDDIVVKIVSARGNQIRVGIEAPRCIPVVRKEAARHFEPLLAGCHEEAHAY